MRLEVVRFFFDDLQGVGRKAGTQFRKVVEGFQNARFLAVTQLVQ